MYTIASKQGCPDADALLAECHEKGMGVKKNPEKALELARKAADAGSPKGMEVYGRLLTEYKKEKEAGRKWLQDAITAGNGDAGIALADTYAREKDAGDIVLSLRSGAKKGSKACLDVLALIYEEGHYGQSKDPVQAACYRNLEKAMDPYATPSPITNLAQQCPMKNFFMPFKNQ
jgi:TPR repeat protein